MILPQRPYLPIGPLRAALTYPSAPETFEQMEVLIAMDRCRLKHLSERLDEAENWSQVLSLGEQQRLALARVFLHKPDWIFLDEASAALDEATEAQIYREIRERLPEATLVSIGHRSSLLAFHELHYCIDGTDVKLERSTNVIES